MKSWGRWRVRKRRISRNTSEGVQASDILTVQRVRLGDRAEVAGQEHLYRQELLPVGKVEHDLRPLVVGPDVIGGRGQAAVEEVEDLRQAGRLGRAQLERQGGQGAVADEQAGVGDGYFVLDVQVKLEVVVQL